jgi:hypothetical protein
MVALRMASVYDLTQREPPAAALHRYKRPMGKAPKNGIRATLFTGYQHDILYRPCLSVTEANYGAKGGQEQRLATGYFFS